MSDKQSAEDVRAAADGFNLLDLTGQTSVAELAAVIAACDALVTADTAACHIAAAVGTPQVALFGSTDPLVTGPYADAPARVLAEALPCAPCGKHPTCAGRFDCMRALTPERVASALDGLLSANRSRGIASAS